MAHVYENSTCTFNTLKVSHHIGENVSNNPTEKPGDMHSYVLYQEQYRLICHGIVSSYWYLDESVNFRPSKWDIECVCIN